MAEKEENEIAVAIKNLYMQLRLNMKIQFNRDIPFSELLFDRWERANKLGFDKGANIYHNSYVYGEVKVGEKTWIGPYTILDGSGGLKIGAYCSISSGVHIYTHDTVKWALSGGKNDAERKPVVIGDCCYIGPQAIITKGVRIGSHSIIGEQSLVKKDVEPCSIVVGTPAMCIGKVIIENGEVSLEYFKKKINRK
jgi:acetyltransferase-like isoleucine patch superfamily enzyme